jgi:hypothetical protein
MVGVQMGDEDPADRLAGEGAREHLAPGLRGFAGLHAGVDHGPAVAVADRPDVDESQRAAQRHPHPQHAGRNLHRAAGLGRLLQRIGQLRTPFTESVRSRSVRHGRLLGPVRLRPRRTGGGRPAPVMPNAAFGPWGERS